MPGPAAIVFDFDGVILESVDVKTRAFRRLFAAYPEHLDAIERLHLEHAGVSRHTKFRWIHERLLGTPLTDAEAERLAAAFSDLVMAEILACDPVPGAFELLLALQGRLPLFVASGTPEDELREIVERRGLAGRFRGVYGTPATKREILARIAGDLGLEASRLLMVGDAAADLEAAREAGTQFVGRARPDEPGAFSGAGVPVIRDLSGLARILGL